MLGSLSISIDGTNKPVSKAMVEAEIRKMNVSCFEVFSNFLVQKTVPLTMKGIKSAIIKKAKTQAFMSVFCSEITTRRIPITEITHTQR